MILRLLFLFTLPFVLTSCARVEPILPEHVVSRPISPSTAKDGASLNWEMVPDVHKLTDRKGSPTEYSFQVSHSEEESTLLMLISGPGTPEKIDVFLDISADIILDRPVQYTYDGQLAATQAAHAGAVTADVISKDDEFHQEWRIDLAALDRAMKPQEPMLIGFDVEMVTGDNKVLRWGQKDNKWLFDRRLRQLAMVPVTMSFGSVTGLATWEDKNGLSPPERVALKRVGTDSYLRVVETDSETGRFEATLPVGEYTVSAFDTRSTSSLAITQRVSVARDRSVDIPALELRSPKQSDLITLIPEVMDSQNVHALGIVYIHEGVVELSNVFGVMPNDEPANTSEAIFKMASVSKPVAALVVISLVEAGLWSLDEPLANYWVDPGLKDDPRHKEITTRMVLRHLTGLPNQAGNGDLAFLYSPQERQSYSGEGFRYLRRAIEAKFDEPFQEIAKRYVFNPAGMSCSSFQGPVKRCGSYVEKFHNQFRFDPPPWGEADVKGGLMINVDDMQALLSWILDGGGLTEETWVKISQPNSEVFLSNDDTSEDRFGLGWVVEPQEPVMLTHGGSEFGARTYIIVIPETQTGLMVATNGSGGLPAIRMIIEATLKKQYPLTSLEQSLKRWETFEW